MDACFTGQSLQKGERVEHDERFVFHAMSDVLGIDQSHNQGLNLKWGA